MRNIGKKTTTPYDTLTLIQLMSPWQGRSGFKKFHVDAVSGDVVKKIRLASEAVIKKTTKKIDGVVIRPTWPTRQGLCLLVRGDDIIFYEMNGDHVLFEQGGLSLVDKTFKMSSKDYLFFRKFTFSAQGKQYSFCDFSNRLISPDATIIYPGLDLHFSPLGRLIETLKHEKQSTRLVSDLKKGRFKYRRLFKSINQKIA